MVSHVESRNSLNDFACCYITHLTLNTVSGHRLEEKAASCLFQTASIYEVVKQCQVFQ